eukprot:1687202-Ditylum_brightwellii.AAC.1
MHFCLTAPERGWSLRPDVKWDGDPDLNSPLVEGLIQIIQLIQRQGELSGMQKRPALSVTETEGISGGDCTQDILYAMHVIEGMRLKVAKPMVLEANNH